MQSRAQIYFFIWIYTTICSYHCSVCARKKSYIYNSEVVYYNETRCCDNYERINTTCVQCPIGFYRPVDHTPEKCIPCLKGNFGQKCAYSCKCHQNESCNSLTGCVSTRGENGDSYGLAYASSYILYGTCYVLHNCVSCDTRLKICKRRNNEQSTQFSLSFRYEEDKDKLTSTSNKKTVTITPSTIVPKIYNIMIYIACTCTVALLMTVALFVQQRRKHRMLKTMKCSATHKIVIHAQKIQENHVVFNDSDNGNVYDITWEQNVV